MLIVVLRRGRTGEMNLSPRGARRRPIYACQAADERDQRARGTERDGHDHDEGPAEQRLPGSVTQPGEVQERSEKSEARGRSQSSSSSR